MKLSKGQQARFWREWAEACRVMGLTEENGCGKEVREDHRRELLRRAGFESLKDVTRVGGFDRVLMELAALLQPDDMSAQMRLMGNVKRVLIYRITHHETGRMWTAIAHDRWRSVIGENATPEDLEKLGETELRQLRDTLDARAGSRGCEADEPF